MSLIKSRSFLINFRLFFKSLKTLYPTTSEEVAAAARMLLRMALACGLQTMDPYYKNYIDYYYREHDHADDQRYFLVVRYEQHDWRILDRSSGDRGAIRRSRSLGAVAHIGCRIH